jgi:hypothetical protein
MAMSKFLACAPASSPIYSLALDEADMSETPLRDSFLIMESAIWLSSIESCPQHQVLPESLFIFFPVVV